MEKKQSRSKIIVVKIGSAVMLKKDGTLNTDFVEHIARQIRTIQQTGISILLVVSGAVATGRNILKKDTSLVERQISAGIGQAYLTSSYWQIFHSIGIVLSQFLLTKSQLRNGNLSNLKKSLLYSMQQGVMPFINENDAVMPNCFGGNDHLAAKIARIVDADELIILSNVDGLLSKTATQTKVIHAVSKVTKKVLGLTWKSKSPNGIGGMRAKLVVAKELAHDRIPTIIANGLTDGVLTGLVLERKHIGTWIYFS